MNVLSLLFIGMIVSLNSRSTAFTSSACFRPFHQQFNHKRDSCSRRFAHSKLSSSSITTPTLNIDYDNWYERTAAYLTDVEEHPEQLQDFVNWVTILRVGIPSLALAASAKVTYATVAMVLAGIIDDSGVFAVVAQDASQFIQNILTTSGLVFALLLGQTYYFMVRETHFEMYHYYQVLDTHPAHSFIL